MTGQMVAHFRVISEVGAGGMGVVYRAHDQQLDREVAIKVLPASSFRDETARARLLREARMASRLNHPNICTVHEVGESEGRAFIAMELVDGRPLSDVVSTGPLPLADVLRYGAQLSGALAHAHERRVVHHDFKSANVVITPDGRAKVLDFGLATRQRAEEPGPETTQTEDSLNAAGTVAGTVAYMAPEQLRGQRADARSDIWALGVVLYEMAAGTRPFKGHTGFELSAAILNQAPPPLPLPAAGATVTTQLQAVIERCLEKDPARRYQSAAEVQAALEAVRPATGPVRLVLRHPRWATWVVLGGATAVAALLVALGVWTRTSWPPAIEVTSLAVLPVTNLSNDPEQEYFSDGMTDALITSLSGIHALRVISRTSVMQYKAAKKRLPEIARELGVDTVLEASVLREAGRVRVAAQLVRASSEESLWSGSFEREFSSVLAIQRDVARAVARTVKVRLRPEEDAQLGAARTVNPATYEAYLRGMYQLNKATQAERQKGLAYFHEAVERDPADPLAHAGLALAYTQLAHSSEARDDDLQRAKAAAATALRLDDSAAEVLVASGFVKGYYEWDWEGAMSDIRRALDVNPSLAMAYYHLAWYLLLFDRVPESIEAHRRAKALDPFNPLHVAWLGEILRTNGQLEEAEAECLKSIEMAPSFPPGHFVLGLVYSRRGRHEEAIAATRKAAETSPGYRWALGPVYVDAGRRADAVALLDELMREKTTPWTAFWRAINHSALGELDEAYRWLDYEPHHAWVPWVRYLDWAEPLRRDPRFAAQLRRFHLPPLGSAAPATQPRS
jgi:serine/threonine protein kinase/tetratricopeptide (TPR) repeat protein